jgi:hypothetical protein
VSARAAVQTAAFVLPILQALSVDPYGVFCVVLTAGRELAQQIGDQFSALGVGMGCRVCVVTGGADMTVQATEVRFRFAAAFAAHAGACLRRSRCRLRVAAVAHAAHHRRHARPLCSPPAVGFQRHSAVTGAVRRARRSGSSAGRDDGAGPRHHPRRSAARRSQATDAAVLCHHHQEREACRGLGAEPPVSVDRNDRGAW